MVGLLVRATSGLKGEPVALWLSHTITIAYSCHLPYHDQHATILEMRSITTKPSLSSRQHQSPLACHWPWATFRPLSEARSPLYHCQHTIGSKPYTATYTARRIGDALGDAASLRGPHFTGYAYIRWSLPLQGHSSTSHRKLTSASGIVIPASVEQDYYQLS